jgi:hypothetical protein
MASSEMVRLLAFVRTDVSEEHFISSQHPLVATYGYRCS